MWRGVVRRGAVATHRFLSKPVYTHRLMFRTMPRVEMDAELNIPVGCAEMHRATVKVAPSSSGSGVTVFPSPHLTEAEVAEGRQEYPTKETESTVIFAKLLKESNATRVEATSNLGRSVAYEEGVGAFLKAAELCWFEHHALRLRPDDMWLLFLQGVGVHITVNAEELRDRLVDHDGKKTLEIFRPDISLGNEGSDWSGAVRDFVVQIEKNTKPGVVDLLRPAFSTTTGLDSVSCGIATMDALSEFFKYVMYCGCGFPEVSLDGSRDDWEAVHTKMVKVLDLLDDSEGVARRWKEALASVMEHFVAAHDGKANALFWNSMLRRGGVQASSGELYLTSPGVAKANTTYNHYSGWVNVFFPYIKRRSMSMGMWGSQKEDEGGPSASCWEWNSFCTPYTHSQDYIMNGSPTDSLGHGPRRSPVIRQVCLLLMSR
eukprot:Sspe_Gene.50860::Locus_28262_Transcript_2_2_Confidence_0.667_Length_1607::g.50860::m.50860